MGGPQSHDDANFEYAAQTPSNKSHEGHAPAHSKSDRGRSETRCSKSGEKSLRVSSRETSATPHKKSKAPVHKSGTTSDKKASGTKPPSKSVSKVSSTHLSKTYSTPVSRTASTVTSTSLTYKAPSTVSMPASMALSPLPRSTLILEPNRHLCRSQDLFLHKPRVTFFTLCLPRLDFFKSMASTYEEQSSEEDISPAGVKYGTREVPEELIDPHSKIADLYECLQTASGLDTSPELDFDKPDPADHAELGNRNLMNRVVEFMGWNRNSTVYEQDDMRDILSGGPPKDPVLPFHTALQKKVMAAWETPDSGPAVNKKCSGKYRPSSSDPEYLTKHPNPESLVVKAATSTRQSAYTSILTDRDDEKMDAWSRKIFSSSSLALKSTTVTCTLARFTYTLWDCITAAAEHFPEGEERDGFLAIVKDGKEAMEECLQSGLDTADSISRSMASSTVLRRFAWLRKSSFVPKVQARVLNMPFDGLRLFGSKADESLK
ncbi:lamina-associated polypeptide 2, isoforms alpha/zeta-like [Ambystoma mexicanum]|uniref:lamina-associated polypeptide 2, isoforms alpha/zeta-like n=1 Tax=Ambystoma mexicanum TaxID=8296 RepID=UPI0037E9067B